jgi:hypothetical protein
VLIKVLQDWPFHRAYKYYKAPWSALKATVVQAPDVLMFGATLKGFVETFAVFPLTN